MFINKFEEKISNWFKNLRENIINSFSKIERRYLEKKITLNEEKFISDPVFNAKKWSHKDRGGGEYSTLFGNVFEKIGVNFSLIESSFSNEISQRIKFVKQGEKFLATGISIVAHMCSPYIPAMHFNTRYIRSDNRSWFGGGVDLTPIYPDKEEEIDFHKKLKSLCDKYDENYYPKFKKDCDEYFFIKHRNEHRGIGGVFFDYIPSVDQNFNFVKELGEFILYLYPKIIEKKIHLSWNTVQREFQLVKRGRYVEFNLIYDRGTKFGLETGGNIDAIFMSLPPQVQWK